MTNTEAIKELEKHISPYENCKADYDANEAIKIAIESLKRDEIGLTDTVKEIHDGVYAEAYEKGRKDAIEECIEKINREHTHSAYHYDVYEAIMLLEQLKEKE